MRAPIYVDLETVVAESVPVGKKRVERFVEKAPFAGDLVLTGNVLEREDDDDFPALARWRIVSLGAFTFEDGFVSPMQGAASDVVEREAVEWFVDKSRQRTIVGWNSRSFDVPLLALRALALGVQAPHWYSDRGARYRYSDEQHLDVKDFVSDYGAGRAGSLDQVARLVGLPGKVGVDGASVAGMIAEGRFQEVHDYCLCDVAQTAIVERRVAFLRGRLDLGELRQDLEGLLRFVDEDHRLSAIRPRIDRDRLLLRG